MATGERADRNAWGAFWASFHAAAAKADPYLAARYEEMACVPLCVELGTPHAWMARAAIERLCLKAQKVPPKT
jgi:hypothetical protein